MARRRTEQDDMVSQLLDPFTIITLFLLVPLSVYIGHTIFNPSRKASPEPPRAPNEGEEQAVQRKPGKARWQCHLLDVLILVGQMAAAGLIVFRPDEEWGVLIEGAGLALLWLLFFLWWWLGVRVLSRRGITEPFQRALVLGVLVPAIYCWPLCTVMGNLLFVLLFGWQLLLLAAPFVYVGWRLLRWLADWAFLTPVQNTGKRRPWRWIALSTVCVLAILGETAPLWSGLTIAPVYYKNHARRFRQQMSYKADIPAIQGWMRETDLNKLPKKSWGAIEIEALPPCVSLVGDDVCVSPNGTLIFTWGGGFGHWGLEVAPAGTPMPPTDGHEYRLRFADGAWVWFELQN